MWYVSAMRLGIVGQMVSLAAEHPDWADVEVAGLPRTINVGLIGKEHRQPGDWILIHAGCALERIDEGTARMQTEALQEYTGSRPRSPSK